MTKQERKNKIHEITNGETFVSTHGTGKRLLYRGQAQEFRIFDIPMEYLILNVENGRIASYVKSYEVEHSTLNPEKQDDVKVLSDFLFEAHEGPNEKTREDIANNGQLEAGIITSDGVIVDGNRRYSLMCSILTSDKYTPDQKARCRVFRTVVLPEDADEKEILRLETSYQMGADEKVGYNPIEKYIHAHDMKESGFSVDEIAEYMGLNNASKVNELLEVYELIGEYLDWCDCSGIYTRLPRGFEDDLLKLNTACKKIRKGEISWIPADRLEDVENELKGVSFDYIRLNMKSEDGFDFRAIASTSKNNFLLDENLWKTFISNWEKATEDVVEEDIDQVLKRSKGKSDSKRLLNVRDDKWRNSVKEGLQDGFAKAKNIIDNKKEKNKPTLLISKAADALKAVDLNVLKAMNDKRLVIGYLKEIEESLKHISYIMGNQ